MSGAALVDSALTSPVPCRKPRIRERASASANARVRPGRLKIRRHANAAVTTPIVDLVERIARSVRFAMLGSVRTSFPAIQAASSVAVRHGPDAMRRSALPAVPLGFDVRASMRTGSHHPVLATDGPATTRSQMVVAPNADPDEEARDGMKRLTIAKIHGRDGSGPSWERRGPVGLTAAAALDHFASVESGRSRRSRQNEACGRRSHERGPAHRGGHTRAEGAITNELRCRGVIALHCGLPSR
jgi:hypothetical protein